jgi:general secretion pathway protein I
MTYRKHQSHGFTLLEVLVALAVISIALLAVGRSAGLQVQTQAELQQRTLALWVADNVITRTRLQTTEVTAGRYQGSELMGSKEWHWELLVQASPDPSILRLDVVVHTEPERNQPVLQHTGFVRAR